jgi:outer membrane protein
MLCAFADSPALADDHAPRWGLGAGAVASANPYAGRGTRYIPLPIITYDSERWFFRGVTGGLHLFDDDLMSIDLIAQGDFDGIDADDFGRRELALNGINRDLLEDRDDSIEAGVDIGLQGRFGELSLQMTSDVLDASGGYRASVEYGYPIRLGERATITPTLGLSWLSADRADYYYGTLDTEVARGVSKYRPGSAVIPKVGLDLEYAFADKWLVLGSLSYESLPTKLGDRPLDDRRAACVLASCRQWGDDHAPRTAFVAAMIII